LFHGRLVFEITVRTARRGYGLGLSLCREIMQAHDGEIALQSRAGGGTTFMLKFPKQRVRAA